MPSNPLDAYQDVERATLSGRELEASVLNKAATLLIDAKNRWNEADHEASLDTALKYNQRIWSFFQVEVSSEENPLPVEIKRNILSLSSFVDRRTFDIMAYPEPDKLNMLININHNIAAGLRGDKG
ncbi:MAG TPA: flagellar biosynthesis regulator FlaF [Thiobacillaceae bacterium]|nr:flagellar biosynthesis regulator FlaF [Thiobacillaceae bacterium]